MTQIQFPVAARFQIAAVPVPNKQFGFIQSMEGNGDSVTEGFWPGDHDCKLEHTKINCLSLGCSIFVS